MSETLASLLLSSPTDRDMQRKIGPSTIGSPCKKCIAEALKGTFVETEQKRQRYWAGAAIGTAVHLYLEERAPLFIPELITERKVTIGELKGYGWISGTADGVLPPDVPFYPVDKWTMLDWKTTQREKLTWIRQAALFPPEAGENAKLKEARFKLESYFGQTHLYAYGMVQAGVPVESILISFIARDAKTEEDFFEVSLDYDEEYALAVWDRLVYIWKHLDKKEFEGHPSCFTHGKETRT